MKTEILTLCQYASEHNGHLTIIDTFDSISAIKFPWRAYFSVACKIDLAECEKEHKTLSMRIVPENDPSNAIFDTNSPFTQPENFGKLNLVASFKGLIFETPGKYSFIVCLDNISIAKCTFNVVRKNDE